MKNIMYTNLLILFFFFLIMPSTQAQKGNLPKETATNRLIEGPGGPIGNPISVSISGPKEVNKNTTHRYTVLAVNGSVYGGSWTVPEGVIVSQTNTNATIKWTRPGIHKITYTANTANGRISKLDLVIVNRVLPPATPASPVVSSQNCTGATLQRVAPSTGVTLYWQGTNSNGTSTANSNSSYTATTTGTYYLRARKNSDGIWSIASSFIAVRIGTIGAATWYADSDGDNLGDPNVKKIQCTQPAGYVSNNTDQCPSQNGIGTSNGCPLELGLSNENYIVKKVYRQPTTTPVEEHDKEKISTTVQYFDGLGRPKQTIAVEAGGNTISKNQSPIDWTLGNTGSTAFYNKNGADSENTIINGTTPFGETDLLWECKPDATSNADGGWNSDYFAIDNTKTYRYSVWVKKNKVGGTAQGKTYHGIQNVNNLNDTANGNPYFKHVLLPKANTWYLLVGVVHPHSYTGNDTAISGVYDSTGKKIADGTEFKWRAALNTTRLRSYLYYTTDTSVRQYFWSPLLQQIDGSELSLKDIVFNRGIGIVSEQTKDIVTHYNYDELGRQTKEYLPFSNDSKKLGIRKGDVGLTTQSYYQQKYAADFAGVSLPSDINAFSEKEFEASPLNRVLQQAAPGAAWKLGNGHEIKFGYDTNTANEVKIYDVSTVFSNNTYIPSLISGTTNYPAGKLYKTITKDENWSSGLDHTTEEFKNKQGQVVLKRTYNNNQKHDTFYIYDDYGNLTYVLPPKTDSQLAKPTAVELSELCYQYKYDYRNRLVEKKIPGKGWEYIVYDKLDRPILTQDAIQQNKSTKEWLFTKYDKLGRVILTGLYKDDRSRASIQALSTNSVEVSESYIGTHIPGRLFNFTNEAFPTNIPYYDVYTINYYDQNVYWSGDSTNPETNFYRTSLTSNTKSLPTTTKVLVLGVSNSWITTQTGYDEKARPVYVSSKNDYLKTTDIIESKLDDFTGKVLETKTTHQKTGQDPIVTIDRFEYDHMDRLVSQNQQVNKQLSERIVKNNYDDLGQLASKLIGNGTKTGYKNVTSGVSVTNNEITKTGGAGWAHGLATSGSISGDGYTSFIAPTNNKNLMVGLSNTNLNASYASIQYAIYCRSNGTVSVYESKVHKGVFGSYTQGDVFRVERIGNTVYYKKNDNVFYTSATASSGTLLGDISMHTNGAKIKDFKIVDNGKGLQKVDYAYNVRGWLKTINEDIDNDNDLFNFSIKYNDPTSSTPLFNGNIAQTSWNTLSTDTSTRSYNYTYDALNRITAATGDTDHYDLNFVGYDKNGNIKFLERNGAINSNATSFGGMDDLHYTYDSGNKLKKVADIENPTYGFKDGSNDGDDYIYDANGNMISDTNKKIRSIEYNNLNLPTRIIFDDNTGGTISYTYDAAGSKLSKSVRSHVQLQITEYAGNYIYNNNQLQFFNTAEGYVEPENDGTYNYIYQYKDHLNNVRLSYSDRDKDGEIDVLRNNADVDGDGDYAHEIRQEKNYYPFGLQQKGYNNTITGRKHKYGFGGKEEQNELGLEWIDVTARNYDPALGRWMNLDPLAEKMRRHSPYNFGFNNPVYFQDYDGMKPSGPGDGFLNKLYKSGKAYVKRKVRQTVNRVVNRLIDNTTETVKEVAKNTKVELALESKTTTKVGGKFELKGVYGAGVSNITSEEFTKMSISTSLTGETDSSVVSQSNKDQSLVVNSQKAGNGFSIKSTMHENGTKSMETMVTTATEVPFVQTETAIKGTTSPSGVPSVEVSSGFASGFETPLPSVSKDGIKHYSLGVTFKIIYTKPSEDE